MDNQRDRGARWASFGALLGGVLGVVVGFLAYCPVDFLASGPGAPKKVEVHTAPLDAVVGLIVLIQAIDAAGVAGLIGAVVGAALGTIVALRGSTPGGGTEPSPARPPPIGPKTDPGAKSAESFRSWSEP